MKKVELRGQTVKELKSIAQRLGIKRPTSLRKDALIEKIITVQKVLEKKKGVVRKSSKPRGALQSALQKMASTAKKGDPIPRRPARDARTPSHTEPVLAPATIEHRYETPQHPQPHSASPYDDLGELPESSGTGRLFLAARDPHWVYAYWDFSWQQMEEMRHRARFGELKLRVHAGRDLSGPVVQEITMNASSRNWFVHVDHANAEYSAEFGYYDHQGNFIAASVSNPARTPSERISDQTEARFATIPFHISFRELFEMVKKHLKEGEELVDVLHRLQAAGFRFPFEYPGMQEVGTADGFSFTEMVAGELIRHFRVGSEFLTERLKRDLSGETSSGQWARR